MNDLWNSLKTKNKPIFIYGMGNGADAVIDKLYSNGIGFNGVFASDSFVRGQTYRGKVVQTYNDICSQYDNFIVITAFGSSLPEVRKNIEKIASEQELYIADAPVYGNTFFDINFVRVHKNEINHVYQNLADEHSQRIFENVVRFKMSGIPQYLFNAESNETETLLDIFKLPKGANIFDLGAFIGDTADKFSKLWPDYGKIIAVEASKKNYQRLLQNASKIPNTHCVNAAIGYLNGSIFFDSEGGRNQSAHSGKQITPSITIDSLTEKYGAPDFIKFDIEGEELCGLIGAEKTIKEHKPAMLISAYHRSEDIISISKKVLSLRSDYKMHIRHFPCIPCWDTYFIFN